MKNQKRKVIGAAVGFLMFCLFIWLKPQEDYSAAERRKLEQFPEIHMDAILNGSFMKDFEAYTVDQFPLRELFRRIKAVVSLKKDNHGLYLAKGYLNSMEYPLDEEAVLYASRVFQNICDKYVENNAVYLSVIPDKNYFLAEENGYLALDYEKMVSDLKKQNANMHYIDIFPLLTEEAYYKTDIHWRQEKLIPVAEEILKVMCKEDFLSEKSRTKYQEKQVDGDFYGVYYGQAALPVKPDKISYLSNSIITEYRVYDYQNAKEIPVYDIEKTKGKDPYEMFLGGSISLLTIENANSISNRELIVFRDSFGSSIAPLLASSYDKTTLIDIRYINSSVLEQYVDFNNADVLFLYSVPVLNNSETLK
ncbi:MAG: hypothetical protein J6A75_09950 [Lachnospiraceae bacterium]|nr:hypothetical protein [Lachnospiraceae bacterium]